MIDMVSVGGGKGGRAITRWSGVREDMASVRGHGECMKIFNLR